MSFFRSSKRAFHWLFRLNFFRACCRLVVSLLTTFFGAAKSQLQARFFRQSLSPTCCQLVVNLLPAFSQLFLERVLYIYRTSQSSGLDCWLFRMGCFCLFQAYRLYLWTDFDKWYIKRCAILPNCAFFVFIFLTTPPGPHTKENVFKISPTGIIYEPILTNDTSKDAQSYLIVPSPSLFF